MSNINKIKEILDNIKDISSVFSDVGRNIVFAIIAGSWVLYKNVDLSGSNQFLKWSLVLAFIYLLIDLIYYGALTFIYDNFLDINKDESSVIIKDEANTFKIQTNCRTARKYLTLLKTLLLVGSIVCILCVVL